MRLLKPSMFMGELLGMSHEAAQLRRKAMPQETGDSEGEDGGSTGVSKINNFDVMKEMGERDLKISMAPLNNITHMQMTKHGLKITIGVSGIAISDITEGKVLGGFIFADKEQFNRVQKEMEAGAKLGTDH